MKTDIRNRKDIELLVDTFYDKIKTDAVIGFLFTEIAQVNWETHLPRMYDFLGKHPFLYWKLQRKSHASPQRFT